MTGEPNEMNIQLLADYPHLIHTLAGWFHEQWGANPEHTVDSISKRLSARLNRDALPLTLVGFVGNSPIASASLKIRELDEFPEFKHWLGTVYVTPNQRGKGFGKMISEAGAERAKELSVHKLYLYTNLDLVAFYRSLGWSITEEADRNGRRIAVMCRTLGDQ